MNEKASVDIVGQRWLALGTTIFTGFTGLVYEVTWHRYLANVVGSQAEATAIILAVFLGGLAVGYGLFGRWSLGKSPSQLLKMLAVCELGIGAWAFIFDQTFAFLFGMIGKFPLSGLGAVVAEVMAAVFILGLPTILMGGTLPLLTQGLGGNSAEAASFHARVYALNTAGAFLGCLFAGFLLLPAWGLPLTIFMMSLINLLAGLVLLALGASLDGVSTLEEQPQSQASSPPGKTGLDALPFPRALAISFLSGCYSIALQTILVRLVGLTLGASEYAFSMIVALYICMLAAGAWGVRNQQGAPKHLTRNQLFMTLSTGLLFLTVPYWPYSSHVLRVAFASNVMGFYFFYLATFLIFGLLLVVPLGTMGRTLPLLFSTIRLEDHDMGRRVGRLYSLNTIGCVCGALGAGYFALFVFDLDQLFKFALLLMLASSLISFRWQQLQRPILTMFTAAFVLTIAILPGWDKRTMGFGFFRKQEEQTWTYQGRNAAFNELLDPTEKLIAYKDGPSGTVAVYESGATKFEMDGKSHFARSIVVNGKSDGCTCGSDIPTMRLVAHLPALLRTGKTGLAAVVGYGTGMTVGSLTQYDDIKQIDTIEISDFVKHFAPHFDFANHGASSHPKTNWLLADAYRILISTSKAYDVIISEPSNPWVAGVENLYTREFYEIVSRKLAPGGIYAQWFHAYDNSQDTIAMVMKTYHSVFPFVHVFASNTNDMIILGSMSPWNSESLALMDQRIQQPAVKTELDQMGLPTAAAVLGKELWLPQQMFSNAALHSLEIPKLAFASGKERFMATRTSLLSLAETEDNLPWSKAFWRHTLLARYLAENPEKSQQRYLEAIPGLCQVPPSTNVPANWDRKELPCRSAILFAVQSKWLADPGANMILETVAGKRNANESDLAFARRFTDTIDRYEGGAWHVPIEAFNAQEPACNAGDSQEHLRCQVGLVQTLATRGNPNEAEVLMKQIFAKWGDDVPPNWRAKLESIVVKAHEIETALNETGEQAIAH